MQLIYIQLPAVLTEFNLNTALEMTQFVTSIVSRWTSIHGHVFAQLIFVFCFFLYYKLEFVEIGLGFLQSIVGNMSFILGCLSSLVLLFQRHRTTWRESLMTLRRWPTMLETNWRVRHLMDTYCVLLPVGTGKCTEYLHCICVCCFGFSHWEVSRVRGAGEGVSWHADT